MGHGRNSPSMLEVEVASQVYIGRYDKEGLMTGTL
jgi:hypothetical protein